MDRRLQMSTNLPAVCEGKHQPGNESLAQLRGAEGEKAGGWTFALEQRR
jgi:hypothetical protein